MLPQDEPSASAEASIAMEQERAWAWIALYVPTVGTSVTLHVALVLVPFASEPPPAFEVDGGFVKPEPEYKGEERERPRTGWSRDFLEPRPSTSIKSAELEKPGFGENPLADLDGIVGLGPSKAGGGPLAFFGDGGPPNLFRRSDGISRETRVVYLVDRSGSITDSIDYVKYELKARIVELPTHGRRVRQGGHRRGGPAERGPQGGRPHDRLPVPAERRGAAGHRRGQRGTIQVRLGGGVGLAGDVRRAAGTGMPGAIFSQTPLAFVRIL